MTLFYAVNRKYWKNILLSIFSVVTKRELSNTEKLPVVNSIIVPMVTHSHESWEMTDRALSLVQATEMVFCEQFTM